MGLEYFAQRLNRPFDKNGKKKNFNPPGNVSGQIIGIWGSNVPLALLIDP